MALNENVKMVELGCGRKKTPGYIGIDRFPLPGVDIVADLNEGLPLEDNSIDIVYASHSLEHLNDISNIMSEIYRICKHKAIVHIRAPYFMTSLNIANHYHKLIFNEDTFRLFTNYPTKMVDAEEYYCPQAREWGQGQSDNSSMKIEFTMLKMEFFYYKEYSHLTEQEKRRARRAFSNVCDQIYYVLAVNKEEKPLTDDECRKLLSRAKGLEPIEIAQLRQRDTKVQNDKTNTVYYDIIKPFLANNEATQKKLENEYLSIVKQVHNDRQEVEQRLSNEITSLLERLQREQDLCERVLTQQLLIGEIRLGKRIDDISYELFKYEKAQKAELIEINKRIDERIAIFEKKMQDHILQEKQIKDQVENLNMAQDSLGAVTLELLKLKERRNFLYRYFSFFRKENDLFSSIQVNHKAYTDSLILKCSRFHKNSTIVLSNTLPYNGYFEYQVVGYGDKINFFLISCIGAKVFVEVVVNREIVKQKKFTVEYEGKHDIFVGDIRGEAAIRFKILDNKSIVRLLQVANRRFGLFSYKSLAAYID